MSLFIILLAVTLWVFYKLWTSAYSYWKDRGYAYIPGHFPFGSSRELNTESKYQGFIVKEYYNKMQSHPMFGIYLMRKPVLVLRDPELVRMVLATEFSHFRDRLPFQRTKEEFLSHHLFNIEGERWHPMRTKLCPTFTSGKLKTMYPLFLKCAEAYEQTLLSRVNEKVDIKDLTGSFTLDVICSCAFGLDTNTLYGENKDLKDLAFKIFAKQYKVIFKRMIFNSVPSIAKKFPVRVVPVKMENFFLNLVTKTIEFRKKAGLRRNDFLDLLLDLKEKGPLESDIKSDESSPGTTVELTYEFITAQCFIFLGAGFETSSSVQSYFLYEMALNPDIQEKVYDEIVKVMNEEGGLTYQAINNMKYLDMAISETMRKYPTVAIITRYCTKTFILPTGQKIEKGTHIWLPTYALQHDEAYYPNPEVFDPERFSEENKGNIKPFTYLPFGEGPRICIGLRFGQIQTKVGLITLMKNYRVEKVSSTPVPMKFTGSFLLTTTDGPIELRIVKRNNA